jgi:hypothetical protein
MSQITSISRNPSMQVEAGRRAARWAPTGAVATVIGLFAMVALVGTGTPSSVTAATPEPVSASVGYLPAQFTNVPYVDAAPVATF